QPMAELPLFSGFAFRAVTFVVAIGIWGAYLAWYTVRFRSAAAPQSDSASDSQPAPATKWRPRDTWVMAAMNGGMVVIVLGGIFLNWGLRQFSAIFVLTGIAAGLAGGLGWR